MSLIGKKSQIQNINFSASIVKVEYCNTNNLIIIKPVQHTYLKLQDISCRCRLSRLTNLNMGRGKSVLDTAASVVQLGLVYAFSNMSYQANYLIISWLERSICKIQIQAGIKTIRLFQLFQ